jgi:LSD1 subclass zinc finger protein
MPDTESPSDQGALQPVDPGLSAAPRTFPCKGCGADLTFCPGEQSLKCAHCGAVNEITATDTVVEENDYHDAIASLEQSASTIERMEVRCDACGANVQFEDNVTSKVCCFCGTPIVAGAVSTKRLKPTALLPFAITKRDAVEKYRRWLASLWFAPSKLAREATIDSALVGAYMPFWTYDCVATTSYTGMRGEDYWVTESYTVTVNGRSERRTRQVRKTRWYPAAGTVVDDFDDVLVPASTSLPMEEQIEAEPWDIKDLVPYADEYLAGFRCESYSVDLAEGFNGAKVRMRPTIEATVRGHIGGDHQRITSMHPRYDDILYKHILLPLWVSTYRYNRRVFRVIINARTGEVLGDRPYSAWKITGLVCTILLIAGIIATVIALTR